MSLMFTTHADKPQPRQTQHNETTWVDVSIWTLIFFWKTFWLGLFIILIALGSKTTTDTACKPDDTFTPFTGYGWWSPASFFQITLRAGSYTFSEVKIIDIVWNLAAGRGTQALLAYVSWRVFSQYIATVIQRGPVTYEVFWIIFLQQESSFSSIYRLLQAPRPFLLLGSRATITFVVLTLCFVLSVPTLVSAMAGYAARTEAYIEEFGGGNYIKFSNFDLVAYIIHNAGEIGLPDDYILPFRLQGQLDEPVISDIAYLTPESVCGGHFGDDCPIHLNVSRYVRTYGFYAANESATTTWAEHTTLLRALEVSAFYLPTSTYLAPPRYEPGSPGPPPPSVPYMLYGYDWLDPRTGLHPFQDKRNSIFTFSNQTYNLSYVLDHGRCQPTGEYQWGYSYIQLFLFTSLMLLWTISTYLMYLKAQFNLPLTQYSLVPEGLECILHMSRAMRKEFKAAGLKTRGLTSRQLQEAAAQHFGGGTISFGAEEEHDLVISLGMGMRRWLMIKKWWAMAFMLQVMVWIASMLTHILWRAVPGLIGISYSACFAVYCVLLFNRTILLVIVMPIVWLALGAEGLKVITEGIKSQITPTY